MSWNPFESPVDFIILAGQRSPGLAVVSGASLTRKWDERRGHGLQGSSLVYKGGPLSKFQVTLRLLSVEHYTAWRLWCPLVQQPIDPRHPRALDIEHPFLNELEIKSAVALKIPQPVQTSDGEWTIDLDFIEFRLPVPRVARPTGGTTLTPGEVRTPEDVEIERLTAQVQELAR